MSQSRRLERAPHDGYRFTVVILAGTLVPRMQKARSTEVKRAFLNS